jgi:hypothetical protein
MKGRGRLHKLKEEGEGGVQKGGRGEGRGGGRGEGGLHKVGTCCWEIFLTDSSYCTDIFY